MSHVYESCRIQCSTASKKHHHLAPKIQNLNVHLNIHTNNSMQNKCSRLENRGLAEISVF